MEYSEQKLKDVKVHSAFRRKCPLERLPQGIVRAVGGVRQWGNLGSGGLRSCYTEALEGGLNKEREQKAQVWGS